MTIKMEVLDNIEKAFLEKFDGYIEEDFDWVIDNKSNELECIAVFFSICSLHNDIDLYELFNEVIVEDCIFKTFFMVDTADDFSMNTYKMEFYFKRDILKGE